MRREPALRRVAFLLALASLLPACRLPDVSSFVESSVVVRTSMGQAGAEYRPFVEEFVPDRLDRFDADWARFEEACDALIEYAQSLDAIVAAGKTGADGAKELAASVDALVGRVGVSGIAASEITGVIADV